MVDWWLYYQIKFGDKVVVRFYLTSKKKNDKWYTMANMLDIQKEQ